MPIQSLCEFVSGYIKAVNDYCEDFADIYGIPDKPDFEHDEEETKLPVLTFGERIVREHTGFDFDRINELDILDYKLLLADACKIKKYSAGRTAAERHISTSAGSLCTGKAVFLSEVGI
ncbi:MAG: hypothetical protein L6V87_09935 [Ruminococcus sp.]|nr:MAG: hypothetical protein L6V87_09935 [Ruminococcus sp.]